MMKRISAISSLALFALTTLLLLAGAARADGCATVQVGDIERLEQRNPAFFAELLSRASAFRNHEGIFWRIEKEGAPPSYVLGSKHVLPVDIVERYLTYLDESRVLFVERTDADNKAWVKAVSQSRPLILRDEPVPLESFLPDAVAADITQKAIASGIKAEAVPYVKPWFLFFKLLSDSRKTVCTSPAFMDADVKTVGMDAAIAKRAAELGIEVRSAETWAVVFDWLRQGTESAPYPLLLALVDESNLSAADAYEARMLYEEGRIAALKLFARSIKRDLSQPDVVQAALAGPLDDEAYLNRNRVMVQRSLAEFEQGGVFMVVGAGHLPGEGGVIALLEDQGFTATRLD